MPDNYSMWEHHEREKEKWLESRPQCCRCGEPIQEDVLYRVKGDIYCTDCMELEFREFID